MSANPNAAEGNTRICISFKGSDGNSQKFNTKKNSGFGKMMEIYARNKNLNMDLIGFYFRGRRLQRRNTPNEVGMKQGGVVDVKPNKSEEKTTRANPITAGENSGNRLKPPNTPDEVEMKERDAIDALLSQSGGPKC